MYIYYFSVIPDSECGRIFSPIPASIAQAPEGWVLCYMSDVGLELQLTKCEDLLVGLLGGFDSVGLLAAGKDHAQRDIMNQKLNKYVITHHDMGVITCHNPPQYGCYYLS